MPGLPGAGNPVPPLLGEGAHWQALPASYLEGNGAAGLAASAAPAQASAPAASPAKRLCLEAPRHGAASSGILDAEMGAFEPSQVPLPSSLSELNAALCTLFALPRGYLLAPCAFYHLTAHSAPFPPITCPLVSCVSCVSSCPR